MKRKNLKIKNVEIIQLINNKESGRYKLIIRRINQFKKRMPRSAPKLFLAHPSLKNLFL